MINTQRLAEMTRNRRGFRTLRDVEAETGLSASTLSRVENQKTISLDSFIAICVWLKVSPIVFMGGTPVSWPKWLKPVVVIGASLLTILLIVMVWAVMQ